MKDSVVFYKSFYEAIKNLPKDNQLDLYNAIFEYSFTNQEQDLDGVVKAMFMLMKTNIDSANKRYQARVENAKKGGRPKKEKKPNQNLTETKLNPNQNLNDNDNVNDNVNDNDNIYIYYENIFGRTLNSLEYEMLTKWLQDKTEQQIKNAIDETAKSNIDNLKYVEKVLYSNKRKSKIVPEWFNKEIVTEEEKNKNEEFESFLNDFRNN